MWACVSEPEVAIVVDRHDLPAQVGDHVGVDGEPGVSETIRFLQADPSPQFGQRGLRDDDDPAATPR